MFISVFVIPSLCHPHTGYNNAQEIYCNWRSASPCGNLNVCYVVVVAAFQRQTRPDQDHISQIADRRSKRIKRQPQPARDRRSIVASSFLSFPFVCFGAIFSRAAAQLPLQLDKSSVQPCSPARLAPVRAAPSRPISISLFFCLCCTLHNCRLLIDRSNNVMDAQPAFDATTRGNPRCMLLYTYVHPALGIDSGMGIAVAMAMAIGMACCMAVSLCFPPHMVRPGPWLGFIFSSLPASGT